MAELCSFYPIDKDVSVAKWIKSNPQSNLMPSDTQTNTSSSGPCTAPDASVERTVITRFAFTNRTFQDECFNWQNLNKNLAVLDVYMNKDPPILEVLLFVLDAENASNVISPFWNNADCDITVCIETFSNTKNEYTPCLELRRTVYKNNTSSFCINASLVDKKDVIEVTKKTGVNLSHRHFLREVNQVSIMTPTDYLKCLAAIIGCNTLSQELESLSSRLFSLSSEKDEITDIIHSKRGLMISYKSQNKTFHDLQHKIVCEQNRLYRKSLLEHQQLTDKLNDMTTAKSLAAEEERHARESLKQLQEERECLLEELKKHLDHDGELVKKILELETEVLSSFKFHKKPLRSARLEESQGLKNNKQDHFPLAVLEEDKMTVNEILYNNHQKDIERINSLAWTLEQNSIRNPEEHLQAAQKLWYIPDQVKSKVYEQDNLQALRESNRVVGSDIQRKIQYITAKMESLEQRIEQFKQVQFDDCAMQVKEMECYVRKRELMLSLKHHFTDRRLQKYDNEELANFNSYEGDQTIGELQKALGFIDLDWKSYLQYKMHKEEHDQLFKKLLDIEKLSEDLKIKYATQQNRQTEEFLDGFMIIRRNVSEAFNIISRGGEACLCLVDDDNPFTGVYFKVKPQGHMWKTLSECSTHEKSIGVLSLLMGINMYKAAPINIISGIQDSVDIATVRRYIQEFLPHVQFIIIREKESEIDDS